MNLNTKFIIHFLEFDLKVRQRQGIDQVLVNNIQADLDQLVIELVNEDSVPKPLVDVFIDIWSITSSADNYDAQTRSEIYQIVESIYDKAKAICKNDSPSKSSLVSEDINHLNVTWQAFKEDLAEGQGACISQLFYDELIRVLEKLQTAFGNEQNIPKSLAKFCLDITPYIFNLANDNSDIRVKNELYRLADSICSYARDICID